MKKRIARLKAGVMAMAITISLAAVPVQAAEAPIFDDVSDHWGEEAIDRWAGYGVIEGSNGLFNPDASITRAEMAAAIARLLGLTETIPNTFTDVDMDAWYAQAVLQCAAAGIIQGSNGMANPNGRLSRQEAADYMNKYLNTFSGVRDYMEHVKEQAKADGYVSTLMGRRRWLPELKSSNFNLRSFGERVALNMPIQGTAADLIKLAMIRVRDRLREAGLSARLILQVHDELIVECPDGEVEQVKALLTREMEGVMDLPVPMRADSAAGRSWAEAKG